ncbi:hypothetical protein [Desulfonema magnum]|uniref:Uncharacterized protein n=1 Tax=Desulfonema magnum TaxID=45655 RepID=A0A975BY71_9BACT|nr:hypothetical protein [Desulfonema magnum]QTA93979.1 Uncharacterized protein dnm_100890 [Desulfonema magnum]
MKAQLEQRLTQLRAEFESGRKMLADLETRKTEIQQSLLRISGAIQVLEEELGKFSGDSPDTKNTDSQSAGGGE